MSAASVSELLARQKAAFTAAGPVSATVRRVRLQAVIDLLVRHHRALTDAMDADFGGRRRGYSMMNDILGPLSSLKHVRDHFEAWMPDEPRSAAPYEAIGGQAWVRYQPKGCVGIIGTWNAPLFTLLSPLACALGAGNRAILKPSEVVPRTGEVLAAAFAEMIDPLEVGVLLGGPDVAQAFTRQPFDHLVFTGSTAIGREVMRGAAEHLVPVTLELGGKSPTLVGRSADLGMTAFRLAAAKVTNGGQICVNPDVTYIPEDRLEAFIAAFRVAYEELLPTIRDNADVTAVVNPRHSSRVESYVADAAARGLRIESLSETVPADDTENRRRGARLVVNPGADALIMQHEIFGPAMAIKTYHRIEEAVADINSRPRPLALYYFGTDEAEQAFVLDHTISGGVCINEAMAHGGLHDAPFGGVGDAGMGHYHGREGFIEFSHLRTVYKASEIDPRKEWGMVPPYPEWLEGALEASITP
ncbi:MAG: aldehyde dehydrogenase family protein [Proteobacteria bacterium]|nr:aldehyde dehydrogenase family protein [Pseudomonadota bacterium]HQR02803.1 aldehyde dehydrogenase family protein [Rhodocyclaceae bacterium]